MPIKYAVNINENHLTVQVLQIFPEFTLGKTVSWLSLLEGIQYPGRGLREGVGARELIPEFPF